jgi:KDO2-lipid IV(A) lauroyltransferase
VVGVLPDQDPGPDAGVFAPFFGVQAKTSTLTARLIAGSDAAPFLTWAERLERGQGYRLHLIELDAGALRCGDVERATRALNLELERVIRQLPRQYLWSYRRFRHRPPGQRNLSRPGASRAVALAAAGDDSVADPSGVSSGV